ncbi:antitoxin [Sphingobium terrigena]|uniref:Antitoxin n=1 Tax=Sphingobium terrigena TaxID=2304063 RepID=A0A418YMC4_9SPHN|nr:antitoxin [Sphingobium terrigena]RJG52259.1 antitoxin [Sphingobium terrigena]
MSRLTIDITDQQHQSLKAMAALQGKTIKQYTLERLFPSQIDDGDQAWDELRDLLQQRIAEGLAGNVSPLNAEDIIADELSRNRHA